MTLERCVPQLGLRAKRRRSTLAAIALTVGILAVFLGGEEGRHFMMPGKLTSQHAGLTDCSTCHSGARSGQVDLLHRLVTAVEPRQNSNLCVTCHVLGAEPFAPHTHSVEDLRRRTETLQLTSKSWPAESLMQRIAFPATARSRGADAEIQCATCHKEHQGVFANLKAVSNQRCQTCHVSRFGSFADSHPQFVKFPYKRRPRIIFDHQTHMTKHFPEAVKIAGQVAPDNCADCHQLGVRRKFMEVKSFATVCAGCHNGDITGATQVSGPKGIDVIVVPGLDVASLTERGVDIGGWPKESEASLTPFMSLLLEANGEKVVSGVVGLDLLDLRKASDQDLARAAALAWAVKSLFSRLETTNPAAAKLRAGDKSEKQTDPLQMADLTGGMSHDVIKAGNQEWFPNLRDDLQRHENGEPTRDFKPMVKPTTDLAKPLPPSVGDSGNAAATPKSAGADILAPGKSAGDNKDDILSPDKDDNLSLKKDDILTPSKQDDSLSVNKKDDILTQKKKDDIPAAKNKDDILSGDKPAADDNILSGLSDDSVTANKGDPNVSAETKQSAAATPTPFDPEVWAQTGGWYREDFAIRYRPTGHADQFLQTWLDFAGRAYGSSLRDRLRPIFDSLSPKDAIGRCTKCHSIDDGAGAKLVNWQPFDPNAIKNRFTNFAHQPHIELGGTKTCVKCHDLQPAESGFQKTYEGGDPVNYTPNFKPMDKAVCAACHSQQTAWENCTLCHGYHVPDLSSNSPVPALQVAFGKATAPLDKATAVIPDISVPAAPDKPAAVDPGISMLAAPDKPAAVAPDISVPAAPDKPAAVAPDISVPAAPDKPAVVTSDNSAPAKPDKPAAIAPDNSPSAKPAKSASADAGEPADLDGVFLRGVQRASKGDFDLAIQDFDDVIRRDPRNAGALNNRCWALAMLDEVEAALKDCDASVQIAPTFPDAFDSRGLVNLKLGLYQKAITDYSIALLYNSKRASALYGRGIAKQRVGSTASAKADIDAAKRIQPTIAGEFAGYGIR